MKNTITNNILVTTFLAALGAPVFALAEDVGYIGASVGSAKAQDFCKGFSDVGFVGSCDDTDTGWKLFSGFQFTPNWGFEVYYVDFGEFKANDMFEGVVVDPGGLFEGNAVDSVLNGNGNGMNGTIVGISSTENAEANAFGISVIGTLPINDQFDVFAKVGISRWELDLDFTKEGIPSSIDADGTDVTFGIGASYSFNKMFAVRVEWERSKIGDHNTTGMDDVDFVSIGAVFHF